MKPSRLALAAAVFFAFAVPTGASADWDILGRLWPICEDPAAVGPAGRALDEKDMDEIERLGCVSTLPNEVWVYVLSCEENARLYYGERLDHKIEWNDKLPESVCEIQAWWPDVWIKLYYTHYMNTR